MIKNIIFDMGGVLVDLKGERCIKAFESIGAKETAQYVRECRTEDLFYDIEIGSISTHDFCNEVRMMCPDCNVDDEDIIAAWNALLDPTTNEKREMLLELKEKGYHLFLLSNTNDMHWQHCRNIIPAEGKTIEEYFEQVFLSYEIGMQKPYAEIYDHALKAAGLNPDETMFIDDNEVNVHAASKLGIHPFHEKEGHRWVESLSPVPNREVGGSR